MLRRRLCVIPSHPLRRSLAPLAVFPTHPIHGPLSTPSALVLLLHLPPVFVPLPRLHLVELLQLGLDARDEIFELELVQGVQNGGGGDGLAGGGEGGLVCAVGRGGVSWRWKGVAGL